jgi:hypothetical protein
MLLLTLLTLAATAIALPSTSSKSRLQDLYDATRNSELCDLPSPGKNCAGASRADVIIQYGKADATQRKMLKDVVTSSGSEIIHDYGDFG